MQKNVLKNKKSISIDWKIWKWNNELMGVINLGLRTNPQSRWLSAALVNPQFIVTEAIPGYIQTSQSQKGDASPLEVLCQTHWKSKHYQDKNV